MRIVYPWLRDLVDVPGTAESAAEALSLRGFEVASVETGPEPVIDFEITANRPDCLSHLGIAREASAVWNTPLRPPAPGPAPPADGTAVEIAIDDPQLCPRYCGQVFHVRVGPSPAWLVSRLEAAGVRSINNIVDVTNYVMLEIGQPMHAFDLARLRGGRIEVRRARPGERLQTLDGVERALEPETLVIADAERPVALAGVMGGRESEVDGGTRRVLLESASFHPPAVRRTSKRLGLKTEASVRFERGGDVEAPPVGIARAAALFALIDAGTAVGPLVDRYPGRRPAVEVRLRQARITRLLGLDVPRDDVRRILEPLGFGVRDEDEGWLVTVPSFRVDVSREADLIEEVGRHFGFDRLPAAFPALEVPPAAAAARLGRERLLREAARACGFSEAMTFAFIEREAALPFCAPGAEPARIANPLSEKYAVLRPSLLPGLIDACTHNRRRARKDVQLFETGSRFTPGTGEDRAIALIWSGSGTAPHWSAPTRGVDFFDLKGSVEEILRAFGMDAEFAAAERPFLVRGRAAEIYAGSAALGVIGQLLPAIADARGYPAAEEIFVAELGLAPLFARASADDLTAEPLPRHPAVVRDVSILIPEGLPAAVVRGTIRSSAPPTLVSIVEFDRYAGKGVPEGRISLSLRLTFRAPDRTLTDEDVQAAMDGILPALRAAHGAEQR